LLHDEQIFAQYVQFTDVQAGNPEEGQSIASKQRDDSLEFDHLKPTYMIDYAFDEAHGDGGVLLMLSPTGIKLADVHKVTVETNAMHATAPPAAVSVRMYTVPPHLSAVDAISTGVIWAGGRRADVFWPGVI